jgi:glycosyltransferase involved in cell wall biosynthesis
MLNKTNSIFLNQNNFVTPFGIDTRIFLPKVNKIHSDEIVIGTVKTLESVYGIDTLIKAFCVIQKRNLPMRTRLLIVGKGSKMGDYKQLARSLEQEDKIEFFGFVNHDEVPSLLQSFDVFVALSRSESFGVSVLEASACGLPVVVSDAEGFVEVVENNKTGLIVPKNDEVAAAKAIEELILDPEKRKQMGQFGRAHVEENYSRDKSLDIMIEAYTQTIQNYSREQN